MKKLFTLCLTISIAILANASGNGFKETFVYGYTDDVAGIAQAAYLDNTEYRKIPVDEYANKMKAAWIGQMIGVGWGAPTEFQFIA